MSYDTQPDPSQRHRVRFNWGVAISALALIVTLALHFVKIEPVLTVKAAWLDVALHKAALLLVWVLPAVAGFFLGWYISPRGTRVIFVEDCVGEDQPTGTPKRVMTELMDATQALTPLLDHTVAYSFYSVFQALGAGKSWLGGLNSQVTDVADDFTHLRSRMRASKDWKGACEQLGTIIFRIERACGALGEHREEWPTTWSQSHVHDLADKYMHFANTFSDFCQRRHWSGPTTHSLRTLLRI